MSEVTTTSHVARMQEGGILPPSKNGRHTALAPENFFLAGWVAPGTEGSLSDNLIDPATRAALQNTKTFSTRAAAKAMRNLSITAWAQQSAENMLYAVLFWKLGNNYDRIPIQKTFNNRLWTSNDDGSFNHITSDDLAPLFASHDSKKWPNIILTSNHARAWASHDLHELTDGIKSLAQHAWGEPMNTSDIGNWNNSDSHLPKPDVQGKTIVVMACNTEKDTLLNGARLIDRRLDLEDDKKGQKDPASRTLDHISPASLRLAKLLLKIMAEPKCQQLIDLDRSNIDENKALRSEPFVVDHLFRMGHEDPYFVDKHPIVLRSDAASIAQHIKLIGYSLGASTTTDTLRFLYQECVKLGTHLKIRGKNGQERDITPQDIKTIISNLGLLNIAPGEVPLTKAEKEIVGIHRVSILNSNDMTAGHLVTPNTDRYDAVSDKLIKVEGGMKASGHSVSEALGSTRPSLREGYIMNPANARRPGYQAAQDEVRAFFASNFRKYAIATPCLWHDSENGRNELSLQFAPGISHASEKRLEAEILEVLHQHGFEAATGESNFAHHRQMQIVLNNSSAPLSAAELGQCKAAFSALAGREKSSLFVTYAIGDYFDALIKKAATPAVGEHTSVLQARDAPSQSVFGK